MKNRIREHRQARGWTIEHLADLVGTSKGHLSDVERGTREASLPMMRSIAQALNVTEVEMFVPASAADEMLLQIMKDFSLLSPEDQVALFRHARGLVPREGA